MNFTLSGILVACVRSSANKKRCHRNSCVFNHPILTWELAQRFGGIWFAPKQPLWVFFLWVNTFLTTNLFEQYIYRPSSYYGCQILSLCRRRANQHQPTQQIPTSAMPPHLGWPSNVVKTKPIFGLQMLKPKHVFFVLFKHWARCLQHRPITRLHHVTEIDVSVLQLQAPTSW